MWKSDGGKEMLIRFNVKNFLSFSTDDEGSSQEFSMIPGKARNKRGHLYDDGKLKLLKFAAVFGANASGKSNFVKAMDFMKKSIVKELPFGHTEMYCKMIPDNIEKASYFEMELSINNKYYSYGFEVILSKSEYVSEWLVELSPENDDKEVFVRNIQENSFTYGKYFKSKELKRKLEMYADDISDDTTALLLNVLNQNKKNLYKSFPEARVFIDVYKWISKSLDINYPDEPISDYSYMSKADNIEEVYRIISSFGTGITGFDIVNVPFEKVFSNLPSEIRKNVLADIEKSLVEEKKVRKDKKDIVVGATMRSRDNFFIIKLNENDDFEVQTIQFEHGSNKIGFNLGEESDGTRRILDLIEVLICSDRNKTYVIDELDRCLHPLLTYKFIECFLKLAENRNVQLVVTTHESRILDFEMLRRDEVWLVEKSKMGESKLYSLEEYNPRFDQKVDKAYLDGRYGAVPEFNTLFPIDGGECV